MTTNDQIFLRIEDVGEGRVTTAHIQLIVDSDPIWPVIGEADILLTAQLDDLLSHLVEHWKPLILRQTYPLGLLPARPSLLGREAADRWSGLPEEIVDEQAETVTAFEDAHDLAHAFGGLFDLPPLWLMRAGDEMIVDVGRSERRVPFAAAYSELNRIGDVIARRLEEHDGQRWEGLIAAWRRREQADGVALIAWAAGLDRSVAASLVEAKLLEPPSTFNQAANDNDPLLIAARMAGALPPQQIEAVISVARTFEARSAPILMQLASDIRVMLDERATPLRPYEEGELAAVEARVRSGLSPSQPIDVVALAERLGVEVRLGSMMPTLEGLAISGERYGPGILLNQESRRVRGDTDRDNVHLRLTLAHELGHLLIDRGHAVSAVDVLKSRMPPKIEQRAKAFAGELLLPSISAAAVWDQAGAPLTEQDLERVLQELAVRFGVSFSVAAWKLEHGARADRGRLSRMLDEVAPYR